MLFLRNPCDLLETSLSRTWDSQFRFCCLANERNVYNSICLLRSVIINTHHHAHLFLWVLGMELDPDACITSTLLTELALQHVAFKCDCLLKLKSLVFKLKHLEK